MLLVSIDYYPCLARSQVLNKHLFYCVVYITVSFDTVPTKEQLNKYYNYNKTPTMIPFTIYISDVAEQIHEYETGVLR